MITSTKSKRLIVIDGSGVTSELSAAMEVCARTYYQSSMLLHDLVEVCADVRSFERRRNQALIKIIEWITTAEFDRHDEREVRDGFYTASDNLLATFIRIGLFEPRSFILPFEYHRSVGDDLVLKHCKR